MIMFKDIYIFLFTTLFWTTLRLVVGKLIKGKTDRDKDIKIRIVSIFHGLFGAIYPALSILRSDYNQCGSSSANDRFIMAMSIGYFFYDTVACYDANMMDTNLVIHHGSIIIGQYVAFVSKFGIKVAVMGLMLGDCSHPAMQIRGLLRQYHLKHTQLYNMIDIVYLLQYIVSRGIFGLFNIYHGLFCDNVPLLIRLTCLLIYAQSYMFIYRMFTILRIKAAEHEERRAKNIRLFWFSENPEVKTLDYAKRPKHVNVF